LSLGKLVSIEILTKKPSASIGGGSSLESQGYCTEEQIIRQIRGKKEEKKVKLKRCLQEILESYNLKRVKANKELKEKFGITSKGYPFLIIKETEE